jgi:lipoprotein-anchoring transpeptidase ErfK/SrfK
MKQTVQSRWTTEAKKLHSIAVMLLIAVAHAAAQSRPEAQTAAEAGERRIIVSIPDRKLALIADGRVIRLYPVAVGAEVSPSPTGEFRIVNRVADPTYYHTGVVIPPGKDNPLGTRWMGLSRKGYGIHGTNQPRSIGHAASHGCIRMGKRDLEQLFTEVRVGDVVEIRAELDPQTAAIFESPTQTATIRTAAELGSVGGQ